MSELNAEIYFYWPNLSKSTKPLGSAVNYGLKSKKVAIQSTVGPYKQLIHAAAVVKANTLPLTAPSITPSQKKLHKLCKIFQREDGFFWRLEVKTGLFKVYY